MCLKGWKYEGRKITDKLHEQILDIIEILKDSDRVAGRTWPALQKDISEELGIAAGQVRTIKRMMEEFGIVEKGVLNAGNVPDANKICTEQGYVLIELLAAEKLLKENPSANNMELIKEIKSIYQLYYQKVMASYYYSDSGNSLHPLRAALKALNKYRSLNYWEWYVLNTVIRNDDNMEEEAELDRLIEEYRAGKLCFKEGDIIENHLSHSYVLGNFEYTSLVCVEGSKTDLKITLNDEFRDVIDAIIG